MVAIRYFSDEFTFMDRQIRFVTGVEIWQNMFLLEVDSFLL